ncbi:hypothetical protein [Thermodesulfobacterium hydrogeniphilum]|nr:hypothetical protein [Thermodesulfobacterium hydrogeniphilum]
MKFLKIIKNYRRENVTVWKLVISVSESGCFDVALKVYLVTL